ncbi:ADP-ribosylglycohydrolase family protein [Lentzea kentuckyensis]|uniref:ADP-ribosylglycohydrolase family protein n=1 Tax=Lentzea kentuckyensis TaxID=360086 RepID=UPI000A3D5143|nr:ADP-ribosylglycohydrolase family protein [Lentzea kentuckyensis]
MSPEEALAIAEKWVAEHKGPEYRVDPGGVHQTVNGWDVGFDVPGEDGVVRASGKWAKHGVEVHVLGTCTELADGSAVVQPRPWKPFYDPEFLPIHGMTSDPKFPAVVGWLSAAGDESQPNPAHVPRQGPKPASPIERLLSYVESGWLPADLIAHNAMHCEVLIPGEASIKAFDYPDTLEVYSAEDLLPEGTVLWHRISLNMFVTQIMGRDFRGQRPTHLHLNPGQRYDTKFKSWDLYEDSSQHLRMCGCGHRGHAGTFVEVRSPWVSQPDFEALKRIVSAGHTNAVPVRTIKIEFTLGLDDQGRRFVVREQPEHKPRFDTGKLRGCLIGGAIGDALGANTENLPMEVVYERCGPDGVTDLPEDAAITDDTQMTLFTFEAMIRAHVSERINGNANFDNIVQHAYQRWLHTQKTPWAKARGTLSTLDEPDGWLITHQDLFRMRAPGLTCTSALQEFARTGVASTAEQPVNNSKGCGGVMRVAPIAWYAENAYAAFYQATKAAALTHGHPSGYLSAGVFAVLVQEALQGKGLLDGVEAALQSLPRWEGHEEVVAGIEHAIELAALGDPSVARVEELGRGGVGDTALAIALYSALVTDDPNEALLISVNHGGDSDSTASMCGNLVGALHGVDKLRPDWVERVQFRDVIDQMISDWETETGPNPPVAQEWLDRYPPS